MKLLPLIGATFLSVAAGCESQNHTVGEHWTDRTVGSSMSRAFLSYDPETDGNYRDFAWAKKQSINLTVRRHLFNHNPENPFQSRDDSVYDPRPPNSPLPRIWDYFHVEGLVMGGIIYAASGTFVPIPIDSVIGTFSRGGDAEFAEGIGETVRPVGVTTASFLHEACGLPETQGHAWAE